LKKTFLEYGIMMLTGLQEKLLLAENLITKKEFVIFVLKTEPCSREQ